MRERIWAPLPLLPLPLLLLLLPPPLWGGPPDSPRPEAQREPGPLQPFDLLYASGVAAYYSEDYERAVRDLEAALRSHRRLREVRALCARRCAARSPLAPPGAGPAAELPFFRALLERARCARRCQAERLGGPASRHRVSDDVRSDFQRRVPYNYLQRAYIKLNQLEKAVEAAHTFFMANPEHMEMQQNIENYRTMAGVEVLQLVDREAKPHLESYSAGVKYYEADDFELAIKYFEQALREYFNEDMECRALCEGPQRFEEYEYLGYKAGLYEAIAVWTSHEKFLKMLTRRKSSSYARLSFLSTAP